MGSAVLKTVARRAKRLGCVRFTYVPAIRYQRFCARGLAACRKGAVLFLHGFAVPPALSATVFSFVHRVSSMPMGVFCRMTTVRRADLSCVVQAGGLSSRMGCDKARMAFCGEPLIERVLGRLAPVAGELVVTTSRPSELARVWRPGAACGGGP